MSTSETSELGDAGLPDLFLVAATRWRLISGCAVLFLVVAIIATVVRQPAYEATAYLEVADEADIATVQDRLRFPSLYERIEADPGAAQVLANAVRVRASRGSRIIGVTVCHAEPAIAAERADAIVDAFVGDELGEKAKLADLGKQLEVIESLPVAESPGSPESLASMWREQQAEIEKLAGQYARDHPALSGARERLEELERRMTDQFAEVRKSLGLPDFEKGEFSERLGQFLAEVEAAREGGESLRTELQRISNRPGGGTADVSIVERATLPRQPAGVPSILIWLGALALGGFTGFLLALCRSA